MKLTIRSTAGLKLADDKSEQFVWDSDVPGFGIRLRQEGARTWVFQYKLGTKQRRMRIGKVSAMGVEAARKEAKRLHAKVCLGEDPAKTKAEARATAHHTFKSVIDEFLEVKRRELRPQSYREMERHLRVHAKMLHGLQLAKISRADIAACLTAAEKASRDRKETSGKAARNRVRSSLSTLFAWTISEGRDDITNPVIGTTRARETPRDRVLKPEELRLIWNALPDDQYGAIIKLIALTGQRPGEIAGLRWSEIKGDAIELPAERSKNRRGHRIPLSTPALAVIEAQPRRITNAGELRDMVFGFGGGPFANWTKAKDALNATIEKANGKALAHWTPHDLRRSFATHCAEHLDVEPHIVEVVLNHMSGHKSGVAGTYNRAKYEAKKRTALDRWAEYLLAIVEGRESNVVPLRAGERA
jgi:integrase